MSAHRALIKPISIRGLSAHGGVVSAGVSGISHLIIYCLCSTRLLNSLIYKIKM